MPGFVWIAVIAVATLIAAATGLYPHWKRRRQAALDEYAQRMFALRREWLEARFLTAASRSGKPRGLAWADCEFDDQVAFARDRTTGQLRAFVGVTISFEAIEGGGMEDVQAVGNLRAATAVFLFEDGQWITHGRTLFNVNPAQAIERFQHEVDSVE